MDTLVRLSPVTRSRASLHGHRSKPRAARSRRIPRPDRANPTPRPADRTRRQPGFFGGRTRLRSDAARDARRAPGSRAPCAPNSRRAIATASRCRREAHARARPDPGLRRRLIARSPRSALPSLWRKNDDDAGRGLRVDRRRADRDASRFFVVAFFFESRASFVFFLSLVDRLTRRLPSRRGSS